jgi:hypothetical protein
MFFKENSWIWKKMEKKTYTKNNYSYKKTYTIPIVNIQSLVTPKGIRLKSKNVTMF